MKHKQHNDYQDRGKAIIQGSAAHEIRLFKGKKSFWFFKQTAARAATAIENEARVIDVTAEVIAQEFMRLISPHQPKTRAISSTVDQQFPNGILSQVVEGFQPLNNINIFKLLYLFVRGKATHLGEVVVLLLYCCERDAKLSGNVGMDKHNRIIKLDGNETDLSKPQQTDELHLRYPITEKVIQNLPLPPTYVKRYGLNWLDQRDEQTTSLSLLLQLLSYSKYFQEEVHGTILRLLLLPPIFIEQLIKTHAPDNHDYQNKVINQFKQRTILLREKALNTTAFRTYLNRPSIKNEINIFLADLENFRLPGRIKITEHCGDYRAALNIQYGKLQIISTKATQAKNSTDLMYIIIQLALLGVFLLLLKSIFSRTDNVESLNYSLSNRP
jgi:hypothetical protein